MTSAQAALAAKLESLERAVTELRREIEALERPQVRSAEELASKIAGRKVSPEELREAGRKRRAEWEARFGPVE